MSLDESLRNKLQRQDGILQARRSLESLISNHRICLEATCYDSHFQYRAEVVHKASDYCRAFLRKNGETFCMEKKHKCKHKHNPAYGRKVLLDDVLVVMKNDVCKHRYAFSNPIMRASDKEIEVNLLNHLLKLKKRYDTWISIASRIKLLSDTSQCTAPRPISRAVFKSGIEDESWNEEDSENSVMTEESVMSSIRKRPFDGYRGRMKKEGGWWISLEESKVLAMNEEWWTESETSVGAKPVPIPQDQMLWMFESGKMYLGSWKSIAVGTCEKTKSKWSAMCEVGYGISFEAMPPHRKGHCYVGEFHDGKAHGTGRSFWLKSSPSWQSNYLLGSEIKNPFDKMDDHVGGLPYEYVGRLNWGTKDDRSGIAILKDGTKKVGGWALDVIVGQGWWEDKQELWDSSYDVDWWTQHDDIVELAPPPPSSSPSPSLRRNKKKLLSASGNECNNTKNKRKAKRHLLQNAAFASPAIRNKSPGQPNSSIGRNLQKSNSFSCLAVRPGSLRSRRSSLKVGSVSPEVVMRQSNSFSSLNDRGTALWHNNLVDWKSQHPAMLAMQRKRVPHIENNASGVFTSPQSSSRKHSTRATDASKRSHPSPLPGQHKIVTFPENDASEVSTKPKHSVRDNNVTKVTINDFKMLHSSPSPIQRKVVKVSNPQRLPVIPVLQQQVTPNLQNITSKAVIVTPYNTTDEDSSSNDDAEDALPVSTHRSAKDKNTGDHDLATILGRDIIGCHANREEMQTYASELDLLGLHSITMIRRFCESEDVNNWAWMKPFHKRAFNAWLLKADSKYRRKRRPSAAKLCEKHDPISGENVLASPKNSPKFGPKTIRVKATPKGKVSPKGSKPKTSNSKAAPKVSMRAIDVLGHEQKQWRPSTKLKMQEV